MTSMVKSFLFLTGFALSLAVGAGYIGFKLGSEKMWANATAFYVSDTLGLISGKYPLNEDLSGDYCRKRVQSRIRPAVEAYGRYKLHWTSKIDLGLNWDHSTELIMSPVLGWYKENSEVDFSTSTPDSYWAIIQSRDPEFFSKLKSDDLTLYAELKEDSDKIFTYIKAALVAE